MPETSPEKCSAIARSGSRCRSAVLPGRAHCFLHDPGSAEARREGARKGGKARSTAARAKRQVPEAMTADELAGYLSLLFKSVLTGKTEPKVGTAAATIAKVLHDVKTSIDLADLAAQVDELRALVDRGGRGRAA